MWPVASFRGAIRLREEPSMCGAIRLPVAVSRGAEVLRGRRTRSVTEGSAVAEHGGAPVSMHRLRCFLLHRRAWKSTRHQYFVGRQCFSSLSV